MKFRITLIFCFFVISGSIYPQEIKEFSKNQDKFLEQMSVFFQKVNGRKSQEKAKKMMLTFADVWNEGKINLKNKDKIINISNLMLNYKMKVFPYFYNYLSTIIKFENTSQTETSFSAWLSGLKDLINQKNNTLFLSHLNLLNNLFDKNILYKSSMISWKSSSNKYFFKYDSILKIVFPSLNLTCHVKKDSIYIQKTKGVYYPITYKWIGKGGKVNWLSSGLDKNKIYAELSDYKIILRYPRYFADSVKYYNTNLFKRPLFGKLEDKVCVGVSKYKILFPKFISYSKYVQIKNLFKNIDYEGGFTTEGNKILGQGTNQQDAYLTFKKNGKKFATAHSKIFAVHKGLILSNPASITIYYNNDSIYHPGLLMKYMDKNKELTLIRNMKGLSQSPYFDSFHKLEIYCEALYWKLNNNKINMKMIQGVNRQSMASFVSYNYYSKYSFNKLQGIDENNPLNVIKSCAEKHHSNYLFLDEIVEYMKKSPEQVRALLLKLANKGFLVYDLGNDKITIKQKLYDYLDASNGKRDYDVIFLNSVTSGKSNATLNLNNFDLKLRGLPIVLLSDSQKVYIYPLKQEITMKKNRDFVFTGRVHAGLFDFFANKCYFDYDKFKLNMATIDSMSFMVHSRKKDKYGRAPLIRVKTVVADLSGDLLIDAPDNKSGLKSIPKYPVFNSKNDAYVYYDNKSIQNGVYHKDKFYYTVYPFTMDSLLKFTTDGLSFKGYLISAGIFPDIEKPLKVKKDYSLGFTLKTPKNGLPIYNGKGIYISEISLSDKGLHGNGTLKYLTSVSKSKDFIFYPDSMNAVDKIFEIKEFKDTTVVYPDVTTENIYQQWLPDKDSMTLTNKNKPFSIFHKQSDLYGSLTLSSSELTGKGTMKFKNAVMNSNKFIFKHHTFDSDTAEFKISAFDKSGFALSTNVCKTHVDFKKRIGKFITGDKTAKVEFPLNQYICFINELDWYMDKNEIVLSNNVPFKIDNINKMSRMELIDVNTGGSEFISINPKQDSLKFFSQKAVYNLKDNIIHAENVKVIKVADAAIFPDNEELVILKKAKMKPLTNAVIIVDTLNKFHTFEDADVNIYSRKQYSAKGNYDYIDRDFNMQQIFFNKITLNKNFRTYAVGHIADSLNFKLSPDFDFKGDVKLTSTKKFLNFDGCYRIHQTCDNGERYWVKFQSDVNPDNIYLPVSKILKDDNNENIYVSTFLSKRFNRIYPAFLSKRINYDDIKMIPVSGYIHFNKSKKEYEITEKDKLKHTTASENYIALNRGKCVIKGQGQINLGLNLGYVKIKNYGLIKHYIIPDSTEFNLVMSLDFFFSDKAMDLLKDSLKLSNLRGINLSDENYINALNKIVGVKTARNLISEINLYGAYKKIPSELIHTLFLTDVKLKWNPETRSYISYGPIGIGNIQKTQINKYVNGTIEMVSRQTGDIITIYLELDKKQWYFFSYNNDLLQAISSNMTFNNIIINTKENKRILRVNKHKTKYEYIISTWRKKAYFLRRIRNLND